MFSTVDKSARDARELAFRKMAAANNTVKMIELSEGININAVADGENSSRQTAAHRAAAAGHVEALRLLFNLGADFSLIDKNKKTPRDLVNPNDHKAVRLFAMIEDAAKALAARKSFYPLTIDDIDPSDDRYQAHHESHVKLSAKVQKGPLFLKLFESYLYEAARNCDYDIQDAETFMDEFNQCSSYLRQLEATKLVFENSVVNNKTYCACGEASAVSAMTLAHRERVAYPVEEINILSRVDEGSGHACVVLGRDVKHPIETLSGMNDALILDPLKGRVFFYQFVKQYKQDTVFKILCNFDLKGGFTNQVPKFPSLMKFPATKKMYNDSISLLFGYCLEALRERSKQVSNCL